MEAILQDSLIARLPTGTQVADSVVPQRFAPAPIIQFIFQQPPWLMWGGIVVALILGLFILSRLWKRRQEIRAWYGSWGRGTRAAFFGVLALLAVGAVAFSAKSYDFNDVTGEETTIDFHRMMKIVTAAGYHGAVGVEYEGNRLGEFDGIRATKRLLEKIQAELAPG